MLGQSIYVSRFDESFIPEKNIDFYFTSMHIAEEFNDEFKNKALKLLKVLNESFLLAWLGLIFNDLFLKKSLFFVI